MPTDLSRRYVLGAAASAAISTTATAQDNSLGSPALSISDETVRQLATLFNSAYGAHERRNHIAAAAALYQLHGGFSSVLSGCHWDAIKKFAIAHQLSTGTASLFQPYGESNKTIYQYLIELGLPQPVLEGAAGLSSNLVYLRALTGKGILQYIQGMKQSADGHLSAVFTTAAKLNTNGMHYEFRHVQDQQPSAPSNPNTEIDQAKALFGGTVMTLGMTLVGSAATLGPAAGIGAGTVASGGALLVLVGLWAVYESFNYWTRDASFQWYNGGPDRMQLGN
jgi:hypothetical protein